MVFLTCLGKRRIFCGSSTPGIFPRPTISFWIGREQFSMGFFSDAVVPAIEAYHRPRRSVPKNPWQRPSCISVFCGSGKAPTPLYGSPTPSCPMCASGPKRPRSCKAPGFLTKQIASPPPFPRRLRATRLACVKPCLLGTRSVRGSLRAPYGATATPRLSGQFARASSPETGETLKDGSTRLPCSLRENTAGRCSHTAINLSCSKTRRRPIRISEPWNTQCGWDRQMKATGVSFAAYPPMVRADARMRSRCFAARKKPFRPKPQKAASQVGPEDAGPELRILQRRYSYQTRINCRGSEGVGTTRTFAPERCFCDTGETDPCTSRAGTS